MIQKFFLTFSCCTISIGFENFEREYLNFFQNIYFDYLNHNKFQNEIVYKVILRKYGEKFTVFSEELSFDSHQGINDLYNITHSIICNLICLSCNTQELVVLHASAFIYKDKVTILAGKKSAGKTTSLLYFLSNGATYIGDEIVVLSEKGVLPYKLPLRVKVGTKDYLEKKYQYTFKYNSLPNGISCNKNYLSIENNLCMRKIEDYIKCDNIIFLEEDYKKNKLRLITGFESINSMLPCIRNKVSISMITSLVKNSIQYSTDFSVPLEEIENVLSE